jgi:hypothetical protein
MITASQFPAHLHDALCAAGQRKDPAEIKRITKLIKSECPKMFRTDALKEPESAPGEVQAGRVAKAARTQAAGKWSKFLKADQDAELTRKIAELM